MLLLGAIVNSAWSVRPILITPENLAEISTSHGAAARKEVEVWLDLMQSNQNLPERKKLDLVNDFFNRIAFIDDLDHWGKRDYWASPVEMLVTQGGDCEDFSIAKYFTLIELGVDGRRMHLTYVKSLSLNQAHMVLTYYPEPRGVPLILDNLDEKIKPANLRPDLLPVYSFNAEGLWLATKRGEGKRVGPANRIRLWRDLITRMSNSGLQ